VREVDSRLNAAASLLAYGLIGVIPLETAAESAVRLLDRSRAFLAELEGLAS
jgi:hypothetical protein